MRGSGPKSEDIDKMVLGCDMGTSSTAGEITDAAAQVAIATGFLFDAGGGAGPTEYFADAAATQTTALNIPNNGVIPAGREATLQLFAGWFKQTLSRVEARREAKRQVEYEFGQTQALEQHDTEFNELLDKLEGRGVSCA